MRNNLTDVISAALRILDEHGLEGCSMRRIAGALEVQPSALYHHVPNKQTLLALMADDIVNTGSVVAAFDARALCVALREAMLGVRDGADVVATASAFRLGASGVEQRLAELVGAEGARTLLLYTFGHAQLTQTHRQAAAFGALVEMSGAEGGAAVTVDEGDGGSAPLDFDASFGRGLDIILRGLEADAA